MRLIIEYTISDDCTYSFNVVEPIIYESKELAQIDFGSKLLEISEQKKAYLKSYDIWLNQFNSISSTNSEKKFKAMQERPVDPIESFEFGGQKFEVYNFITTDIGKSDRIEEYFQEPNFYTIDEWFKKCRI